LRQSSESFVFQAEHSVIEPGETAVLRWNIRGATSVFIEETSGSGDLHTLGKFSGSGNLRVRPQDDSTYVISCEGSTTVSCASVSVRVKRR
jgi:hypothetical protein